MAPGKFASTLEQVKKVKHVRWLLPGWVFYEYYKVHKQKGHSRGISLGHGVKAEAMRFVAMASLPVPGTYELTTTGLALLRDKIAQNKVANFTLKAFKDFIPVRLRETEKPQQGPLHVKLFSRSGRTYFRLFYRGKK